MEELLDEVIGSVLGVLPQSLSDDSSIENTHGWDSLRQLSILLALESAYGISITTDQALGMTNMSTRY